MHRESRSGRDRPEALLRTETTRSYDDAIRQVFEAADFGPALSPELRTQEERQRAQAKAAKR